MPWKETGRVIERARFIVEYLSGCFTISELAARYGVSRKTLYKWLSRHDRDGLAGLHDRPRITGTLPHRTPTEIAQEIVAFKRRFPFMGPKKIVARLCELHPNSEWAVGPQAFSADGFGLASFAMFLVAVLAFAHMLVRVISTYLASRRP